MPVAIFQAQAKFKNLLAPLYLGDLMRVMERARKEEEGFDFSQRIGKGGMSTAYVREAEQVCKALELPSKNAPMVAEALKVLVNEISRHIAPGEDLIEKPEVQNAIGKFFDSVGASEKVRGLEENWSYLYLVALKLNLE